MGQIGKLNYTDGKLGAPTSGQQTTRILFNTITAPGTTSSLEFFKNFQGLTQGQTNLATSKLDSMESMVVKEIMLLQLGTTANSILFGGSVQQTLDVVIGNQTVVKDLPIHFNSNLTGQAFDRLHFNGGVPTDTAAVPTSTFQTVAPVTIRLLTDIVLPPQVNFYVRINSNAGVYGGAGTAVVCALSGSGKIFSAGASF